MGYDYPLVIIQKAIEHGPVEIVDLPMKNSGFFHGFLYVYRRVNLHFPMVFLWFSYGFQIQIESSPSPQLPWTAQILHFS